jgi:hypothetical protein
VTFGQRVRISARFTLPFGCPRDGWRVIGKGERGMVKIACNGQRLDVWPNQIEVVS